MTHACRAARISRTTIYEWRDADENFAKQWDAALELGISGLEDEAVRRAFHGVLKPVYQKARRCGSIREYSDTLLVFLLKAHRPKKFRENVKIDGTLSGGVLVVGRLDQTADDWAKKYTKAE